MRALLQKDIHLGNAGGNLGLSRVAFDTMLRGAVAPTFGHATHSKVLNLLSAKAACAEAKSVNSWRCAMRLGILAVSAIFAVTGFSGADATTSTTIGFGSGGAGNTWTENGYLFTAINRDNSGGNCPFNDPACMALNNNSETVMTAVGGGQFSLLKFNFEMSGAGTGENNEFDIFADGDNTTTLRFIENVTNFDDGSDSGTLQKNVSYRTEWVYNPNLFTDVTSITFRHVNGGTVRIDDVMVSAIPLPLGATLLVSALGLAAAFGRRRLGWGHIRS